MYYERCELCGESVATHSSDHAGFGGDVKQSHGALVHRETTSRDRTPLLSIRALKHDDAGHATAVSLLGMLDVQYKIRGQPGRVRCSFGGPHKSFEGAGSVDLWDPEIVDLLVSHFCPLCSCLQLQDLSMIFVNLSFRSRPEPRSTQPRRYACLLLQQQKLFIERIEHSRHSDLISALGSNTFLDTNVCRKKKTREYSRLEPLWPRRTERSLAMQSLGW